MKKLLPILVVLIPFSSLANTWTLEIKDDPLTDESKTVATQIVDVPGSVRKQATVVRCVNRKLEVFVEFGDFLGNKFVKVRHRIDKKPLVEELWMPSGTGTALFASSDAGLARQWMNGGTFIIEASDFRGVPHRASFDLVDAPAAIEPVLKACGVATRGMEASVPGLREEIATHLERWGPKTISVNKRILADRNAYAGPLDTTIEPAFALAVQGTYDDWIGQCRAKKVGGIQCRSMPIMWDMDKEPSKPLPVSVIYEMSSGSLKAEAGRLKIGE